MKKTKVIAIKSLFLSSALVVFASACTSNLVENPNFPEQGPWLIKKQEPRPEPEPEPAPEPAPEPQPEPVMTVSQQNAQAIEAFTDLGFNSEETDKGVVVYLPPSIYFKGSTSDISLDARSKISEIAGEVNKDYLAARRIEVSGHTDSIGDADLNMALSKRRAEAAAQELVFSRVSESRLLVSWFGEHKPLLPEVDSQGLPLRANRDRNRRVEFTILNPS